ncbi:MAG: prepilin peptidase [Verrucomicrobia bacterium]|nr:MAG: prepilin peptidase [Verrucomicrobiota bacterium]
MFYPPLDHWLWLVPAFSLGACIGSFLNVVIYRVPLELSVNNPKRSFCPQCKAAIPLWLNVPLLSWLYLRGKCRDCGQPIALRYFAVELLTALVFTAVWLSFAPLAVEVVVLLWALAALLIAIAFIDAEHMIIPVKLTWTGSALGLMACAVWPHVSALAGGSGTWQIGLLRGGVGWAAGFFGLGMVVELGKLAFGKKDLRFPQAVAWSLREAQAEDDPMWFVIADEEVAWWDIFNRKSDRLLVEAADIRVDGESVGGGLLTIRELEIQLPDGTLKRLAALKSLDGTATRAVIPREAMGSGDGYLLGMVGAFFGWSGVLFTLFSGCVVALLGALVGRIGFGKQLPFGPSLAVGAALWMLGGWKLFAWYMDLLGPLGVLP